MMRPHSLILLVSFGPGISKDSKDSSSITHSQIKTKLIYLSTIEIADSTNYLTSPPFPSFFEPLFSIDRSQYFFLSFDAPKF
jgi:hypothetical protein